MVITFKAKPYKVGVHTYVVTLPKQFINNGYIPIDRELQVSVNGKEGGGVCSRRTSNKRENKAILSPPSPKSRSGKKRK